MARILLTQPIHPRAEARPGTMGEVVTAPDTAAETLRRSAKGCDVVVVRAALPDDLFDAAPTLVGAVRHGAGVDMIPIDAATARGVLVANVPGVNANAVAEHVLRCLLQLARQTGPMESLLRRERSAGWARARAFGDRGIELAGRTLGIVGFGNVGQAVARLCGRGLAMAVLAHSRSGVAAAPDLARAATLPELLRASDAVVLACPLNDQTRGLIGAAELAQMRRGAVLVNVARGAVVVESALVDALGSGHLGGAAIDVFDRVPLPDEHPFWQWPQVVLTPHVAGITDDSMQRMGEGSATAVECLLRGRMPPNCLNPQAWPAFEARLRRGGAQPWT